MNIDLARKDELANKLTSAEMTEVKNAIDIPRANVNIIPYHIYDEDEHIVGEWRQTIDGVKKKKPVYEKTIEFTSSTQSSAFQIQDIDSIISQCGFVCTTSGSPTNKLPIPWANSAENFRWYLANGNTMTLVNIGVAVHGSVESCVIFHYTKTTDSWEVVA